MVFSSSIFILFFLPIVTVVYYLIVEFSGKTLTIANIWLLLVSLFFYAWGEPVYVLVMIVSITVNYAVGKLLIKTTEEKRKKIILATGCILDLGNLFVFKYLQWILGKDLGLALPIGISFYTFQAISYIIDVYRSPYSEKQTSFINVGLYIAFFPQLIAGPIIRYSTVAGQIERRHHKADKFSEGIWRFAEGFAKKVLIANRIAPFADMAFANTSVHSALFVWIGAVASMLQIYFDFSGYSDMAIGLGKMFGFDFEENFNYPFMSKSITEYWRRWHISLGRWFKDYLYYPLSLGPALKIRRKSEFLSSAFVLFSVWLATGIWHGANMTFVVWGLLQFVIIMIERKTKQQKVICHIRTVLICILCGVVFKADSLKSAVDYYRQMLCLAGNPFTDKSTIYWISQYGLTLLAAVFFSFPVIPALDRICMKHNKALLWNTVKTTVLLFFFISSLSYTVGSGYNPFIYFNF